MKKSDGEYRTSAFMHDIGIRPSEQKFGRCDGQLQEQEGMASAMWPFYRTAGALFLHRIENTIFDKTNIQFD